MTSFLSGCLAQSAYFLMLTSRNQGTVHKRKLHIMADCAEKIGSCGI